jgi:hypothetical protein
LSLSPTPSPSPSPSTGSTNSSSDKLPQQTMFVVPENPLGTLGLFSALAIALGVIYTA